MPRVPSLAVACRSCGSGEEGHAGRGFVDGVDREWQQRALLRSWLQSIRDTVRQNLHEVMVVDNASDDGSADVEREFPECRLIRLTHRDGSGASQNYVLVDGSYDMSAIGRP